MSRRQPSAHRSLTGWRTEFMSETTRCNSKTTCSSTSSRVSSLPSSPARLSAVSSFSFASSGLFSSCLSLTFVQSRKASATTCWSCRRLVGARLQNVSRRRTSSSWGRPSWMRSSQASRRWRSSSWMLGRRPQTTKEPMSSSRHWSTKAWWSRTRSLASASSKASPTRSSEIIAFRLSATAAYLSALFIFPILSYCSTVKSCLATSL